MGEPEKGRCPQRRSRQRIRRKMPRMRLVSRSVGRSRAGAGGDRGDWPRACGPGSNWRRSWFLQRRLRAGLCGRMRRSVHSRHGRLALAAASSLAERRRGTPTRTGKPRLPGPGSSMAVACRSESRPAPGNTKGPPRVRPCFSGPNSSATRPPRPVLAARVEPASGSRTTFCSGLR